MNKLLILVCLCSAFFGVSCSGESGGGAQVSGGGNQTSSEDAGNTSDGGGDGGMLDVSDDDTEPDAPSCENTVCDGVCCEENEVCTASDGCVPREDLCGFSVCGDGEECENDVCIPACAGTRCGEESELCCEGGDICVFAQCMEPGTACEENVDCAFDELCEQTFNVCLPADADPNVCTFRPPVGEFAPEQEWQWSGEGDFPEFNQVMMMPAVANMTDDNGDGVVNAEDIPDVVFSAFTGSRYNNEGVLRIVSGDDGRLHRELQVGARAGGCPALADIDGNGSVEIIVERSPNFGTAAVMAVDLDGNLLWENAGAILGSGGASIADLDGDGSAEIIARDRVISAFGSTLCRFAPGTSVPISADIDLDGTQEILNGSAVFDFVTTGGECPLRWSAPEGVGGFPAIGNFDDDPEPEIVLAGNGRVAVMNHFGGVLWNIEMPINPERALEEFNVTCEVASCDRNAEGYHKGCCAGGGPPTVADVDNDGQPEITIASRWFYLVYETDGSVRWSHSTKDFSSAATGSSVFDFEGDGRAEVIYNDEGFLRIYDGAGSEEDLDDDGMRDAVILFETPNPSGTLLEYPLIVDVDNDGNAEIVVAANNYAFEGTTGIRVFGDTSDNWVRTRRIWNQHAYHVTHITEDAQVVSNEPFWWQSRLTNSYRLNVQPFGLFNAPNLVVEELDFNDSLCDTQLTLTARVANIGSLGVREGVRVDFLRTDTPEPEVLCSQTTEVPLAPGTRLDLSCTWELPNDAPRFGLDFRVVIDRALEGQNPTGDHNECIEDDNAQALTDIECIPPG